MINYSTYTNRNNKAVLLADLISGALLLLLLYTALSKLWDHETFRFVLKKSPLLSPFAGIIAIALPITELIVAVLLFLPGTRLKGLYASLFIITVFTVYLIYMVAFASNLPCGCGGALNLLTWKQHIFFNLFFILLSLTGVLLYQRDKNRRSSPPP